MPSVSNYVRTEEAERELEMLFEDDLRRYRKVQKERELEMIRSKLEGSKSAKSRQQETVSKKPTAPKKSEKSPEQKKHK